MLRLSIAGALLMLPGGVVAEEAESVPHLVWETIEPLMRYFENWHPAHPPGTDRTYSNPSIGLLG